MAIVTPRAFESPVSAQQAPEIPRQVDTVEAPVAEAPAVEAVKEESLELSPKFLALARQQKILRKQQMELKAREDAIKAEADKYNSSAYISAEKLKADPGSILSQLGIQTDQLLNAALNQPTAEARMIQELRAEIDLLKNGQKESQTKAQEEQQRVYDEAVNQIRNETKNLISTGDTYEMIKSTGTEEAVVELIKETFEQKKILLTVEEAATQVEEHLLQEAIKMASYNKVKLKMAPPVEEQAPIPQKQQLQITPQQRTQPQQIKTLTNAATATSSKPLSQRERRERAIAAFKGELR